METEQSGDMKTLAITGLVIAILALLFSLIPCVGYYAIIPAILAIIFCLISYLSIKEKKGDKITPISGLVIALLALMMAVNQYYKYQKVLEVKSEIENSFNGIKNEIEEGIKNGVLEEFKENLEEVLDNDSIQKSIDEIKKGIENGAFEEFKEGIEEVLQEKLKNDSIQKLENKVI